MQARRLLTTLFAAAMFSTSCAAISGPAAVAPPPPPVDETINTEAAFPDDGLTRVIVTPIAGAPVALASSGGDGVTLAPTPGAEPLPVDPSRQLTPDMVAQMPPGAILEARDGKVGYIDDEGNFVAFDPATIPPPQTQQPAAEETEPAEEIEPRYGNPYIDALATDPAIKNVIVIGDGTFGLETSDPSVIDPAIFSVVDDVPFGITTDQYEPYQWAHENTGTNLDRVTVIEQSEDADLDLDPTIGRANGKGIVVAVIDSGVDFSHPDLENSAWSNLGEVCGNGVDDDSNGYVDDCNGWDFAQDDPAPFNAGADSHGTHVAGIITANRDGRGVAGIAPDARIMDLNVALGSGSNLSIRGASIVAAIRYAVDNGADIINLSLGTQPGTPASAVTSMGEAIDYAQSKGVIVVAAAGNNNVDLASLPVYPASFNRPNMIVVGASTPTDTRASFSNYNASIVDVYAPGVLMLSTVPGADYRFMSGTSQASPATAATAALVMQTYPDAPMAMVIDAVTSTSDRHDALSTSTVSGRVNAASAIGEGDAPPIPTELEVDVRGLLSPGNEVAAEVAITTPPEVFDEAYQWELSLLSTTDNGVYAIIDHPFLVDGASVTTGPNGALVLGSADIAEVALATNLPAGRYSFVIEAVATEDTSFRLGDAFVTSFEIAGEDFDGTPPTTIEVEPPTEDGTTGGDPNGGGSDSGDANGGDSNSGESGSSTTAPGATAPSTTAPSGGASPTTSPDAGESSTSQPAAGTDDEPGQSTTTAPSGTPPTTAAGDETSTTPTTTAPTSGVSTTAPSTNPDNGGSAGGGDTPSTTIGDGDSTTPPSTAPPSTTPTGPAPEPDGLGSGVAKKGAWESTSVSPQAGYVNQANSVVIRGNFPSDVYVWFGGQPGQVIHQNRDSITVRSPLRATPGIVDITLQKSRNGVVLEIPDAYAFVDASSDSDGTDPGDPDSGNPGSGGTDSGNSDSGNPDGGGSDSDNGSNDGGSTNEGSDNEGSDSGSSDGGEGDGGSGDETPPTSDRRDRMLVGSPVELSNGLIGASVTPNVAANTPPCSNDPCRAVRR